MNTVRRPFHHPSESLLLAYAGGSLGEAESIALSTHLTLCPQCRRAVASAEAIGGALLEDMEAAPVSADGLKAVLARLEHEQAEPSPATRPTRRSAASDAFPDLPQSLVRYAEAALAETGWRRVAPGVQQLRLKTGGSAKARLLRLKPGTLLPEHSHRGSELTLVLSGSYTDELGCFGRGDMAELDDSVTHRPIVDLGQDCVALIVTEAPLKFSGLVARIAQPFVGI